MRGKPLKISTKKIDQCINLYYKDLNSTLKI